MDARPETCNLERFRWFEVTNAARWGPSSWNSCSGGVSDVTEAEEVAGPRRFPAFRRGLALLATKAFLKHSRRRLHTTRARQPAKAVGRGDNPAAGRNTVIERARTEHAEGRPMRVGPHRRNSTGQARRGAKSGTNSSTALRLEITSKSTCFGS